MSFSASPEATRGPIVLDSSALLALCFNEPGADLVEEALATSSVARMTAINIAECTSKLIARGWHPDEIESLLQDLDITVVREEHPLAVLAGELHARSRDMGLSMGDALCLATALRDEHPVFTADRAWSALAPAIPVVVIR